MVGSGIATGCQTQVAGGPHSGRRGDLRMGGGAAEEGGGHLLRIFSVSRYISPISQATHNFVVLFYVRADRPF